MSRERSAPEAGLLRRIERRRLVVTLTGGAIRAHTTLLTKELQTRFGVHVAFNELVADPTVNRARLAGALTVLEEAVEALEDRARAAGAHPDRDPIHAVLKVQPYHVTPAERVALFRLAPNAVFSIRDPLRTTESILRGMLEITHLRAVRGEIEPPRLEAVTHRGADLGHVRGPGWSAGAAPVVELDLGAERRQVELDPFGQHVRHMIETRDYSSLGTGFVPYFSYYPVLDGPDLKHDLWSRLRAQAGAEAARRTAIAAGWRTWEAMVGALADTVSTEFDRLPEILALPLRYRRTGWRALAEAMALADDAGESYAILDSLDLLAAPQAVLAMLGHRFGLPSRTARPFVPYARFDPGFGGLPIQVALFRRVAVDDGVGPPRPDPPLPPSRLPEFLLAEIDAYYRIYVAALAGASRLRLDTAAHRFVRTEPTSLYARLAAGDAPATCEVTAGALRGAHPDLVRWFDAIDAA